MSALNWHLDGTVARLAIAGHEVYVDACQPGGGLYWQSSPSSVRKLHALGVVLAEQQISDVTAVDAFTRGPDFVVTYAERLPCHPRAQIYWRCLSPDHVAPALHSHIHGSFDLILSVNTSVLDQDPQTIVRSTLLPVVEVLDVRADDSGALFTETLSQATSPPSMHLRRSASTPVGCFIVRMSDSSLSYIEMVHPTDYQQSDIVAGDGAPPRVQLEHQLFSLHLEKGVILRARVRCALVDRKYDQAIAIEAYQRFSASEPPLTA